jgi:histidyl-tRNA synthetase
LRPLARTPAEVLVTTMDPARLLDYLKMAQELREAGINTEVYLEQAKFKKQLEYAERKGFRVALIAGGDEFAQGAVQVKNLATRTGANCPRDGLVQAVRSTLNLP